MVELVEVEDESFETKQTGPSDEDDYYTDTDSEISSDDEENVADEETFADRLLALRDIVPPTTRSYIAAKVETATSWVKSGLSFSGKGLWVISTSALLLGVPFALAYAEEQQFIEMEKEMKMREAGEGLLSGNAAANLNAQLGAPQSQQAL
ncbi:probable mitochondrial receptor complex chain MOM22 [Rhynchosporium graminicola]|uniref:Probable mitochondrial receptor complex chain MOM22 n=1 Tax=Rhynchosporium graminicola TaxID=2792576 RepID=A0A1E1LSJ5_9HELO|nr:probable mitochondrial receptor complex chain MOM22 [Rhynchosporium commune]